MDAAAYVLEDLDYEVDDVAVRRARLVPVGLFVVAALLVGATGIWMVADVRADSADQAEELRLLEESLRSTSDDLVATKADVQRLMGELNRNLDALRGGGAGLAAPAELQGELDELEASVDELNATVSGWRADREFFDGEIAQIDQCLENLRLHASELGDGFELTC